MKALLNIKLNNQAFIDDPGELSRILRDLADKLEHGHDPDGVMFLMDINGNTVGKIRFSEEYQGWSNPQTWCVAGFFNNTKELQEEAKSVCKGSTPYEALEIRAMKYNTHISNFADWAWPDGYRRSQVDWVELANHFNTK